jgi:prevent-host-death family protein
VKEEMKQEAGTEARVQRGGIDLVHHLVYYGPMRVNIHEAKTRLSELLNRVESGEEIIIARAGTPIARLVPIRDKTAERVAGTAKGKVVIEKSFDEPLPESLLGEYEG